MSRFHGPILLEPTEEIAGLAAEAAARSAFGRSSGWALVDLVPGVTE